MCLTHVVFVFLFQPGRLFCQDDYRSEMDSTQPTAMPEIVSLLFIGYDSGLCVGLPIMLSDC